MKVAECALAGYISSAYLSYVDKSLSLCLYSKVASVATERGIAGCRDELVKNGEEATEVGGYFICNGIERIIRMIILQRRHYIMALKRSSYLKRGPDFTEFATLLRYGCRPPVGLPPSLL